MYGTFSTELARWTKTSKAKGQKYHHKASDVQEMFWSTVDYRGGWQEPDYLAKKIRELQRAGYGDEKTVWVTALGSVQREIMPQCVLSLVQSLCPNPPGQPYTGHRWN